MTNDDKAKAYDEAMNKIKPLYEQAKKDGNPIWSTYEYLIPELRESEDERVIRTLYYLVRDHDWVNGATKGEALAWLEKQKECLADNGKTSASEDEKIRKELINFLRSPFIKENLTDEKVAPWLDWLEKQKEPTTEELYAEAGTTEKEYIANTMKKVRAMRERKKEQKPELVQQPPITYTYNSNASRDERLKAALLALLNSDLLKVKEGGYFTKQDLIEWVERIPTDKPAEWSEEDEDMLNCCISSIEEAKENRYAYKETDGDTSYDREIAFLKSLRPSWKPSEDQMEALNKVRTLNPGLDALYQQLKNM